MSSAFLLVPAFLFALPAIANLLRRQWGDGVRQLVAALVLAGIAVRDLAQ